MADAKITISATDLASDVFQRVGAALKDMGDHATGLGPKLKEGIEDPMQAARAGVSSILETMGPLGETLLVVGGVAGAAGFALFELAERAIAVGEALQDFSYKTSITVEAASALSYTATVAGSSLDQMGAAIFMMQKRMEDDSTGNFAAALGKIHLTLGDIQALTPDQQFIKIAEAFKENTTQTDRASVAMALFGRAGRDLAPLLMKDLGDLTDQAKELGHVMSGEDAKGAEDLAMAWRGFKESISWTSTEVGFGVVHFFQNLGSGITQAMYLLDPLADDLDKLGQRLAGTLPHVKDIMSTLAMGQDGVALSAGEAKAAEKELEDEHKVLAEAQKKAAVEAQKWSDLLHEIGTVGQTTQITIDALSGSVVEGTKFYLEHGVAIDKIAKLYGITKEQVDAVKQSIKDESDTLKVWGSIHEQTYKLAQEHEKAWRDEALKGAAEVNKSIIEGLTETTAARLKLEDFTAQQTLLSTDYQVTKIWEVANQQIAAFKGTEQQRAAFNANILALADAQTDALYLDTKALHDNSIDSLQDTADKAAATYLAMVDAPDQYSTATIERFHRIADAAQEAADGTEQSWTDAFAALKGIGNSTVSSVIDQFVRLRSAAKSVQSGMASDTSEGAVQAGAGLVKLGASAVSAYQQIQEGGAKATASGILSMTETGAAIGSIIPGIGTAVGAGIGAIVGVFAKLTAGASAAEKEGRQVEATFEQSFGGFNGMMAAVGAAYAATGRSAGQAQADVKALMDAEVKGGDAAKAAADKIKLAFTEQTQDATDLDAAVKKYGFSLGELGPAMQKQQLGAQAAGIENDFRLLAGSGMDVKTVIDHMGGSINDFLANAQKTGSEVPTEMKPILEKMIEMGTLTDANGNKITDLGASGITFSETMTQGFGRIVDKLTDLINKIAGTTGALNAIPTSKTVDITYAQHTTGDGPPGGAGQHTGDDGTSYANEGFDLTRPTRAIVGDNPLQSESVLHASTVKDIVRAARSAGAQASGGDSHPGTESRLDAIATLLQTQGKQIAQLMGVQAFASRDALLARGTR